ncbi:MFS transporter [Croceivirga thetidis]|uniref:MFS transporter n=1 Tax=Croceivirga thetidis TaxID=2721623 RepID=A0ABX1GPQ7_9FLAO|nr:MFS transporter [Croceivirga thetidis]NKI31907.1 MFS transporter [Croceivirga thetidis]
MTNVFFLKGNKKLLNAWAFYDWATSVYNLTISSAVFPIYYGALFRMAEVETVEVFGHHIERAPLIGYVSSVSFVIIALITPLISGIADYIGNKRIFLKFFTYLGAFGCIGLYWFSLDQIYLSLICYMFGLIGSWVSFALYNSYLPDIAYPEQQDKLSAKGFSLGYVGSVLLLIFNLIMVMKPELFGLVDTETVPAAVQAMKISFVTVGVWWIVFSQYTFYHLPKGYKKEGERRNIILNGFLEIKSVWHQLQNHPKLKKYLRAFFVYSMAVQTIMLIAAYFGEEEIQWGSAENRQIGLITSILLIQLVAIIGAYAMAFMAKRIGNIKTLIIVNIIWFALCIYAYTMVTPTDFYIGAGLVGLVMGGIQAISRSTYSKFIPETTDTTSFFSFYDVSEKIGIIIGLLAFAYISEETDGMRNSALAFALFFIVGAILLIRVFKEEKLNSDSPN